MKRAGLLLVLLLGFASVASADPIFVFKEPDGSIRFTNRPPPVGVTAKVFAPRSSGFSWYSVPFSSNTQLFRARYNEIIQNAAKEHGVDAQLIKAVIHVESAFNPSARSPKGAQGLMQLMPDTARNLGVKNAYHPEDNISGGAKFLRRLIEKYNGNLRLALAAYNAGEDAVDRYNGIPPYAETQEYVKRVLQFQQRYKASVKG